MCLEFEVNVDTPTLIMSVCEDCKESFVQGDVIATCCVCMSMYHCNERSDGSGKNCSSASSTEVRVLRLKSKSVMLYRCKECRDNGGMSPHLLEVISSIKDSIDKLSSLSSNINKLTNDVIPKINNEIADIKSSQKDLRKEVELKHNECKQSIVKMGEKIDRLEGDLSPSTGDIKLNADEIVNEITERKARENNILLYNIPEQIKSGDAELETDYDLKQVLETLKNINNLNTKLDLVNVKRLGKFSSDKVRPIIIKFDSRADATNVITHWRLVPKSVQISYDLTKFQRDRFNALKLQAKMFNADKSNKMKKEFQFVRFRNGNPVLVTSSSTRKKQSAENDVSGENQSSNLSKNL